MFRILLLILLSSLHAAAQKRSCTLHPADTLLMLAGTQAKYWDKIDHPPLYGKKRRINEGWYIQRRSSTMLRYKYSGSNKRYEPIETDILIGQLGFSLKGDTLLIPSANARVLITRITKDSLIVHDLDGGFVGDALFIRSNDQQQRPEPAVKPQPPAAVLKSKKSRPLTSDSRIRLSLICFFGAYIKIGWITRYCIQV